MAYRKVDPELKRIFEKYGGDWNRDVWDCHGTLVAYHKALERIAAQARIKFKQPVIIEANNKAGVAILVTGILDDGSDIEWREEWSIGEASPDNTKNSYPWAMAEKRAKDRVVLKLLGLHGHLYSEEEADDFKAARPKPYTPKTERKSAHRARKDGDWNVLINECRKIQDPLELKQWYTDLDEREIYHGLPDSWKRLIDEEYVTLLTALENSSAASN